MVLSAAQKASWDKKGFLHLPQFFGDGQELREWTDAMSRCESAGQWMKCLKRLKVHQKNYYVVWVHRFS